MTNTAITADEISAIMADVVDLFGGVMEAEPEPTPSAEDAAAPIMAPPSRLMPEPIIETPTVIAPPATEYDETARLFTSFTLLRFITRCAVPRDDAALCAMIIVPAMFVMWFGFMRLVGAAVADLTLWGSAAGAAVVFALANGIAETINPDPGRYHAEQSAWAGHDYSGWSQCSASRSANLTGSDHMP